MQISPMSRFSRMNFQRCSGDRWKMFQPKFPLNHSRQRSSSQLLSLKAAEIRNLDQVFVKTRRKLFDTNVSKEVTLENPVDNLPRPFIQFDVLEWALGYRF